MYLFPGLSHERTRERKAEGTHPEVDAYCRTGFILRQPLLVGEPKEKTALPHRRVSDEEELDIDGRVRLVLWLGHRARRWWCRECEALGDRVSRGGDTTIGILV